MTDTDTAAEQECVGRVHGVLESGPVEFDSILYQNHRWYWRMSAGGKERHVTLALGAPVASQLYAACPRKRLGMLLFAFVECAARDAAQHVPAWIIDFSALMRDAGRG